MTHHGSSTKCFIFSQLFLSFSSNFFQKILKVWTDVFIFPLKSGSKLKLRSFSREALVYYCTLIFFLQKSLLKKCPFFWAELWHKNNNEILHKNRGKFGDWWPISFEILISRIFWERTKRIIQIWDYWGVVQVAQPMRESTEIKSCLIQDSSRRMLGAIFSSARFGSFHLPKDERLWNVRLSHLFFPNFPRVSLNLFFSFILIEFFGESRRTGSRDWCEYWDFLWIG